MNKKLLRISLIILIGLLIIESLHFFLTLEAEKIVREDLISKMSRWTNDRYHLEFEEIDIHLICGSASIERVKLNDIQIGKIDFKGLNLWELRKKQPYSFPFSTIRLSDIAYPLPNDLYTLQIDQIVVHPADSLLRIEQITYVSKTPKWEFAYQDPKHSDWMDVRIGKLELKNLHLQRYLHEKEIHLDSLLVSNVHFGNYKNRKIPTPPKPVPLVYELVQRVPIPFQVDYVKIADLDVEYEELAPTGTDPGYIRFTDIEGIFSGFTNRIASHTQTNTLTLSGKLMNEGKIQAEMQFPVDSTYDEVSIRGALEAMNMLSLNKMLEPMAPARIRSGFIERMDFNIVGGKEQAQLDMCLLYHDLSVEMMHAFDQQNRVDMPVLSLFANGLIRRNNPELGQTPFRVHTSYIRDPYHSAFNYVWKIYFSGLMETLGYTQNRKQEVNWLKQELKKKKK
jgi:hypothetical protein